MLPFTTSTPWDVASALLCVSILFIRDLGFYLRVVLGFYLRVVLGFYLRVVLGFYGLQVYLEVSRFQPVKQSPNPVVNSAAAWAALMPHGRQVPLHVSVCPCQATP
jgi:hypothetical protein